MQKTIIATLMAVAIVSLVGTAMAEASKTNNGDITAEIGKQGWFGRDGHFRAMEGSIFFFDNGTVTGDILIRNEGRNVTFHDDDVRVVYDGDFIKKIVLDGSPDDNPTYHKTVTLKVSLDRNDDTRYVIDDGVIISYDENQERVKRVPVNSGSIVFTTPIP